MDKASEGSEPSTAATSTMFGRNDDRMTIALRSEDTLDLNAIIQLNKPPSSLDDNITSTAGTRTATVFSSKGKSSATKVTSAGTSYPIEGCNGKGKGIATYSSSLSATNGSGSEAEAEQDTALVGIGDWVGDGDGALANRPLRGRACKRPRNKPAKSKKPVVIIQHDIPARASSDDKESPAVKKLSRHDNRETKYVRKRTIKSAYDQLSLAEEGRPAHAVKGRNKATAVPLSPTRFRVLIALCVAIGLTFALSIFAAHYTGKGRMACTKGIVFAATVMMSCFTVLAMVVARRALQEALLAGLLEFLIGFALVIELRDFLHT